MRASIAGLIDSLPPIDEMKRHFERKMKLGKSKPRLKNGGILPAAGLIWNMPAGLSRDDSLAMGPHQKIQDLYKTIEALMVLYNMAIDFKNRPNDELCIDENPDDQDDETNGDEDEEPMVSEIVGEARG
ncbi:hypothetical protein K438DRAFT_1979824 [Mycena galopus ATCC 62051]|nr:hypothetical protein K438DRAFT_1979824 [Mycena galopus ATCC 62051]